MEREGRALMTTYKRYPIVAERGEGCRLWDVDGRAYLDFLGGLAVDVLGHAPRVIAAENSFHGRTLGTVAATWNPAYRAPFEPLPEGFDFVPFDDIDAMADAVTDETVAVMLEPIQAEGGLFPASDEYLRSVRQLCDERKMLLILDEVQTGIGRAGTLWAHTQWGIEPDIMTL